MPVSEERPRVSEDDRNVWIGVGIVLFGGLCAAACVLIYLSAAFMDHSSDRAAWQLWLSVSAGLALGSIATGLIIGTVRRRTATVWAIPVVLLAVPIVVMFCR